MRDPRKGRPDEPGPRERSRRNDQPPPERKGGVGHRTWCRGRGVREPGRTWCLAHRDRVAGWSGDRHTRPSASVRGWRATALWTPRRPIEVAISMSNAVRAVRAESGWPCLPGDTHPEEVIASVATWTAGTWRAAPRTMGWGVLHSGPGLLPDRHRLKPSRTIVFAPSWERTGPSRLNGLAERDEGARRTPAGPLY